jgi:hypothetical protein
LDLAFSLKSEVNAGRFVMVGGRFSLILVAVTAPSTMLCGCGESPKASDAKPPTNHVERAGDQGKYNGWLDGVRDGAIVGWAYDYKRRDDAVTVVIYEGETMLGEVKANRLRKDLADKNIGTGKYGFAFQVSPRMRDGKPHQVRAKIKNSTFELKNSPKKLVIR